MNKRNLRIMLTIIVVAFVGQEVSRMVANALNEYSRQQDIIRRIGRTRRVRHDYLCDDEDWLVKNIEV